MPLDLLVSLRGAITHDHGVVNLVVEVFLLLLSVLGDEAVAPFLQSLLLSHVLTHFGADLVVN